MSRTDADCLEDMLEAVHKLADIVARGRDSFDRDWVVRSAAERQLEVIGEAAEGLSEELAERRPDWPLQELKTMRELVSHEYFSISADRVWNTITTAVPEFAASIPDELQLLSRGRARKPIGVRL